MRINRTTKKAILIIGSMLLVIILTVGVLYAMNADKNKYGDDLEIKNLDTYTEGKPTSKDSIDYIKYDLLRTVNKNVKTPVTSNSVKDIIIRDDTFSQSYNEEKGVYTVNFIVDIKSLSQSYDVSYQWSNSGEKDKLTEGVTAVKCLPVDKLIYGEFDCKDMFTELSAPTDPILAHLPYSSLDFKVTYDPNVTKTLNATIYTTAADERTDPGVAIEQYKKNVKEWVASTGVNANEYKINYTLVRASLF